MLLLHQLSCSLTSAADKKLWTAKAQLLDKFGELHSLRGWPNEKHNDDPELIPYFDRQNELSAAEGCFLWISIMVISKVGREKGIETLHDTQLEISKMKTLAGNCVW